MLNGFSIREGMSKNKKEQGVIGKVTGALGGAVTNVATATGKAAANTLKGTAKLAGQGVNV